MRKFIIITLILAANTFILPAQISFRTEYLGKSDYKDFDNKKNGGRGDALVISGAANLPISFEPTDDGRIKALGLTLNSSFTSFSNNDSMLGLSPDKIFNNRAGLLFIRPVWKKWSLLALVGVGTYTPHTKIGKIRFDQVLFDGAGVFVWHLRKNLDVGAGIAFNSSFGYPMGFPALYIKWTTTGRYFIEMQMIDGMNLSAGTNFAEWFSLSLVADVNGSTAMHKVDGIKKMFSHTYMTASLQPEFRIGSHLTVPIRAGVSFNRTAYYEERTLRAFFKGFRREYDPHYNPSLYLSAGININF